MARSGCLASSAPWPTAVPVHDQGRHVNVWLDGSIGGACGMCGGGQPTGLAVELRMRVLRRHHSPPSWPGVTASRAPAPCCRRDSRPPERRCSAPRRVAGCVPPRIASSRTPGLVPRSPADATVSACPAGGCRTSRRCRWSSPPQRAAVQGPLAGLGEHQRTGRVWTRHRTGSR